MSAIKVKDLNKYIKKYMAMDYVLSDVSVEGEISNVTNHRNGNIYFSLKDDYAKVNCICYYMDAQNITHKPVNGQNIVVRGSVSFFERDGSVNIFVRDIKVVGLGDLHERYLVLKDVLYKEGLFNESLKKKIPFFPKKVGVITSSTGAAIKDIINVLRRRNPAVSIYLYPSLVQGEGTVDNLIEGLDYFENSDVDTIIIGRGGGSIEDLFSFNDESLARKIFSMQKPIISAVGHEIDYVISDFVSDLRAPTPSVAAELVSMSKIDLENSLFMLNSRLNILFEKKIENNKKELNSYKSYLDSLIDNKLKNGKNKFDFLRLNFKFLEPNIYEYNNKLKFELKKLNQVFYTKLQYKKRDLKSQSHKLNINRNIQYRTRDLKFLYSRFLYVNLEKKIKQENNKILNKFYTLKDNSKNTLKINSIGLKKVYAEMFKDSFRKIEVKNNGINSIKNSLDITINRRLRKESAKLMFLNNSFKRPSYKYYVFIRDNEGRIITSAKELEYGNILKLDFEDGSVDTRVEKIKLRGGSNE